MTAREAMRLGRKMMEKASFRFDLIIANDSEMKSPVLLDNCNNIHLSVPLHNTLGNVQTSITFEDQFVDIRTFPDPILVDPHDRQQCMRMIELLNGINCYIKTGRYYLDRETGDIALWERIPYWIFEIVPETLIEDVILEYEYYEDLGDAIMGCADGSLCVPEAVALIEEMWGMR